MSTTLAINLCNQSVGWDFEKTTAWGVNIPSISSFQQSQTFANGTGAGKAQRILIDQVTITTGSTQTYALDSYTDPFGQTSQAMTKVHGIFIQYLTTNSPTGNLEIAGTFSSNSGSWLSGTTPKCLLYPGNSILLTNNTLAGYTVTTSTGNTLTIKNTDGSVSAVVNVCVWGE